MAAGVKGPLHPSELRNLESAIHTCVLWVSTKGRSVRTERKHGHPDQKQQDRRQPKADVHQCLALVRRPHPATPQALKGIVAIAFHALRLATLGPIVDKTVAIGIAAPTSRFGISPVAAPETRIFCGCLLALMK